MNRHAATYLHNVRAVLGKGTTPVRRLLSWKRRERKLLYSYFPATSTNTVGALSEFTFPGAYFFSQFTEKLTNGVLLYCFLQFENLRRFAQCRLSRHGGHTRWWAASNNQRKGVTKQNERTNAYRGAWHHLHSMDECKKSIKTKARNRLVRPGCNIAL